MKVLSSPLITVWKYYLLHWLQCSQRTMQITDQGRLLRKLANLFALVGVPCMRFSSWTYLAMILCYFDTLVLLERACLCSRGPPSNLACSHFCAIHSWIYLAMVTLKLSFTTTWQIGTHLGFTYSCWYFWHKLGFTWTFGTFKKTWTLGVFKNTWTSPS